MIFYWGEIPVIINYLQSSSFVGRLKVGLFKLKMHRVNTIELMEWIAMLNAVFMRQTPKITLIFPWFFYECFRRNGGWISTKYTEFHDNNTYIRVLLCAVNDNICTERKRMMDARRAGCLWHLYHVRHAMIGTFMVQQISLFSGHVSFLVHDCAGNQVFIWRSIAEKKIASTLCGRNG